MTEYWMYESMTGAPKRPARSDVGVRRSARKPWGGRAASSMQHGIGGARDHRRHSEVEHQRTDWRALDHRHGRVIRGHASRLEHDEVAVATVCILDVGVVVVVIRLARDGNARGEHHRDERQGTSKSPPVTKHTGNCGGSIARRQQEL